MCIRDRGGTLSDKQFSVICFSLPITEVWLGQYQGSKVAIKMLKDLRDAKASQLFLREASVMT